MDIEVRLFASLQEGRFNSASFSLPEGSAVATALAAAKVAQRDAAIIFLNTRHASLDSALADGDVLAVFPPIGGG